MHGQRMTASVWVEGLGRSLQHALDLLESGVRDCSDALWEASMWPVPEPEPGRPFLGIDWLAVTDTTQRRSLAERWVARWSTPWSVAWHALEVLDYDLNGEFSPWSAPPPFTGHPHWRDLPSVPRAWSRSELRSYIEYCRERVRVALASMTDEQAAKPLPSAHRFAGQPHAWVVQGLVGHTAEHAAQIRQFIASAGPDAS